MFWAKAFKGEEETNDFERVLIVCLRVGPMLTNIIKGAGPTAAQPGPFH